MVAAIPATVGGIVIGFLDSKLLGTQGTIVRNVGKVMTAILVSTIGRRWLGATGSGIAMGAILGTIGHEVGVRLGGGMVTMTKREGVRELVEMAATDAETQAELGALIEDEGGDQIEGAVSDYEAAIEGKASLPKEYAALEDEDD
jgi:hypothetical protein